MIKNATMKHLYVHYLLHLHVLKLKNMIVISPTELRTNLKKYLDLAKKERVVIQRGRTEMFELVKRERIEDSEISDLNRAITGDELLERVIPRIEKLFEK